MLVKKAGLFYFYRLRGVKHAKPFLFWWFVYGVTHEVQNARHDFVGDVAYQ